MLHHSLLQLISGLGITTPLAYLEEFVDEMDSDIVEKHLKKEEKGLTQIIDWESAEKKLEWDAL